MKSKIFIIVDNLAPNGTQRQILEYLKFADCEKFDFTIVNLDKPYNTLENEIKNLNFKVIGIDHKGFFNISTLKKLVRLFKQERPDIVHTYLFTADLYGRIAAIIARGSVIITSVRNVDLWKKWYHILADRALSRWTDRITINAENIKPFLVQNGIPEQKIMTIYNGIDLRRFDTRCSMLDTRKSLEIKDNALVVGMVSRFSEQKDYQTFLETAEVITKEMPNVCFVAVGDGEKRKEFEWRYALNNGRKIFFTGLRKDIPELIKAMDICVLSSQYEGCPNVILEYMACYKPVIASNVGGCAELVVDGETGFIIPPSDVVSLKSKIIQLIKDQNLRVKMGKEGRKHAEEHFASEIMVRKTEALYSGLLKTKMKKDRQVPRSFSHIYSLWKRIFRWGPKNWFLRIFWVLGLLITKPFKHGEEFIRYRMYKDISSVIEERSITGKTLSISHSLEICKYLQNCDIIEANYPEYNCLKLPFPDESFDCVVSDMVIEHIQGEPQETVDESYRILKKDGYLILTTNFIYPWHGCPGDFWRFTQDGLKYLCRHFSNIMASGNGGNRSFIIMRWLGLHKLPVPHFKYHPLHIMSCKINKDWPMVTWIIAKK